MFSGIFLWRNITCSGLPARSTAVITTASTVCASSSICAISRDLETEFSSEETVKAGPEKSHKEEIRDAIMLPIKLVKRLIGTSSERLSLQASINWCCSASLKLIPASFRLSSIWVERLTLPLKRWISSSVSIATSTATFCPSFSLVDLIALSVTSRVSNCWEIKCSFGLGCSLKFRKSISNDFSHAPFGRSINSAYCSIPFQRSGGKERKCCLLS